ncbi:hypothetical protein ACA910_000813 [Epithemia clementina (nom. ined.)]
MTSTSAGFSGDTQPSGFEFKDAFVVAGTILGALVILAVGHFVFYFILDLCINLDGGARRRHVAECLRKVFPFWNVRTQPTAVSPSTSQPQQRDLELGTRAGNTRQRTSISPEALTQMVPSRILFQDEVDQWKKDNTNRSCDDIAPSNHSDGTEDHEGSAIHFPCSICLNEMKVGDKIFEAMDCNHLFHFDCFLQWVISSSSSSNGRRSNINIHCPNCRTPLQCIDSIED